MGKEKYKSRTEILQGTLDLLILKALAGGAMHGYAVAEWIHESSQDVLRVEEGALYPALHRLELRGLLSAEWGTSENNRRAKYYALTTAGSITGQVISAVDGTGVAGVLLQLQSGTTTFSAGTDASGNLFIVRAAAA